MNTSDQTERFAPLTLLAVPVPPNFAEALGYTGNGRFVGCYWQVMGDEAQLDDGRLDMTGEWDAYLAFVQHPKVYPAVRSYRLGSSDTEARDMLIIDRQEHRLYVAPRNVAAAFLDAQWPPLQEMEALPMSAEELLDALHIDTWTEERIVVDSDEITRRIEAREQRVAELIAWLDKQ